MKAKSSILHKLLLLLALPVAAALVFSVFLIDAQVKEFTLLRELEANTRLVSALSTYINALQVERGTSSLMLSGGDAGTSLNERRAASDEAAKAMVPALAASSLASELKVKLANISDKSREIRGAVDRKEPTPAEARAEYTELVRELLAAGPAIAKGGTSFGVGKALTSVILL